MTACPTTTRTVLTRTGALAVVFAVLASAATADALRHVGIGRGSRVAIVVPNSVGFVDAVLSSAGLTGVLLVCAYREAEVNDAHPLSLTASVAAHPILASTARTADELTAEFGTSERATRGTNRDADETGTSANQGHGHPREERGEFGFRLGKVPQLNYLKFLELLGIDKDDLLEVRAVGAQEENNLRHLVTNLGDSVGRPWLTSATRPTRRRRASGFPSATLSTSEGAVLRRRARSS